ncbi:MULTISPECIES: NHLP leader peptide family RiPP precursor [Nitrospirillum]|uniref:Putative ribosomally synthesized peptide n=1 Tax=Nitrospirillum amazonense TaxID=28077 RepID=A0A560G339_9PROT|nr:NHLP leader peptide family RiPP precursor [Nitrospirillum amazonense]MEC4593959.1 NHLP leader peptide family RiPP precursor [Nitrospirillum amazonense]TWB28305.1 putative ribosomally synthesized peptide [Nitrospirillum amazonense]
MTGNTDNAYGRVVAKAWADAAFKARLLADPAGTLAAEGVVVPPGVRLTLVEDSATIQTLVLPARPADLSDDDLAGIAGGTPWPRCMCLCGP